MIHSQHAHWRGDVYFSRSGQYWGGVPRYPALPLRGGALSVQAISWVIENSKHSLGSFIVLFMIANHARDDGTGAWPSIATLARESRMSERQVRYCLRRLERSGELQTQIACGPYGTNMYSLPQMRGAKFAPRGAGQGVRGGNLAYESIPESAPNPSLTVPKDKEELFQLIHDYHDGVTHLDEQGKRYKISPSTRKKIYCE